LDQELSGQLQRRRALLNTCLEALLTYCSVTTHYPTNYPEQNRSHAWSAALSRVFETPSVSPDDFQQAITDFEMALIPSALPKSALAVNSKLRKYIQDMYARANKLGERLRSLNSQDVNALEEAVQENMNFLRRFFEEYGRPGAVGMVCFLVMAVSPLIRRWLYMEQTAHSAGERLSDLTSKDGDWFLDELCTMSGNVSQVVDVMEMCIETMVQGPIKETSLLNCSIIALREVHRVYSLLQDLMGSYQLDILPRCVEYLLKEDPVFIGKMEEILNVTIESQPEVSVRGLMARIVLELKNTAMKDCSLDSNFTVAIQELKTKFKVALTIDCSPDETLPSCLRIFAELIQALDKIEETCTFLFTALERIAAPVEWGCVDLFKEAEGLLFSIPGAVLYVELFFLRKVIAVYDVCYELKMLRRAYKVDIAEEGDGPSLTPPTPPQSPVLGTGLPNPHVPSENILAQPIRRYISDTLTTHLLGQPTHTLCCITLSILHQLGVPFENRPVVLDELCRMAHDQCQPSNISPVLHQARQLYSSSDLAWREWDKAKRLMHNLKVHREAMSRFNQVTTCFQWLHEEALSQPESGQHWVGSQRSTTLIPLKRASGDQIISSVSTVREKVQSQHFRISQRLQWAAGANPGLNLIVDDFERAVNNRNKALQVEEDLCSEIIDLCKTVIHLESTHSRTVIKTAYDKEIIHLLGKGAEVFSRLSQCNEHLAKVSDIVPLIELPTNEPVTMSWMSSRLEELNNKRNRISKDKKDANHKLAKYKESILSDLEKLRGQNRNYKKLMLEIWQQLTTLGKLDPPLPHGQLNPGPRTCIGVQNQLSEGTKHLIQVTHELIAADLSLAKPSVMDASSIEKYIYLRDTTRNLRELLEWLLDQLNSFVQQLFTNQSSQFLPWAELPPHLLEIVVKHERKEDKPYHIAHGVFRDPRTGKALQQQNTHAVAVWRRVKAKLDGRDFDNAYRMSVTEQVDYVIQEAISPDNLCELYEGWTPWV
jgi:PI-3-kinase-related kinase SMG-1